MSSTFKRCLLSSQLRISVRRRLQVSLLSWEREVMISFKIIYRVCTSVDLQTFDRIGSRSCQASTISFLSSKFLQSKSLSISYGDLLQRSFKYRLMHLAIFQWMILSSKQQDSSQTYSSKAWKSMNKCFSCDLAKMAMASRKAYQFCSARGLPYLTVKQVCRYQSREVFFSWMLCCLNLDYSISSTSYSYVRTDTFLRGLAGRQLIESWVVASSCLIFTGEVLMAQSDVCLAVVMSLEQSCEFSSYSQ